MNPSKILVLGWGRAGKDAAGAFFNDHLGLRYCGSTSWSALPLLAEHWGRPDQLVWEERHQNRQLWKDTLDGFRKDDPTLLIRRALLRDPRGRVVTGVRDRSEVLAAKEQKMFKHVLWIERPGIPPDPTVTFSASDCTDFVKNDGSLRRFHRNLIVWAFHASVESVTLSDYAKDVFADLDPK
jgi:hypothetical protein